MTQNTKINAGEVIVLTEGCYSSYGIAGYIVATRDFDMVPLAKEFMEGQIEDDSWEHSTRFIAFLISKEYCVPVAHREIHLCDYSTEGILDFKAKEE